MSYNKKIAIVYKSKYGCTMKYAGWLAIKLDADLYEVSDVGRWDLLKYKTIMEIGDKIPEMLGIDQDGREIKASDYRDRKIVLYSYPKANTSGCTAEAC